MSRLLEAFERADAAVLRDCLNEELQSRECRWLLHPLGFYYFRLGNHDDVTIRVHYWKPGERSLGSAITQYHDHVWDLRSCILAGELENRILALQEDPTGDLVLASVEQVGETDRVVPSGQRVTVRIDSRQRYTQDAFYGVPPRVFHCTIVPPHCATLTIVRATLVESSGPRTLIPLGHSGHAPIRKQAEDFESIAGEVLSLLRGTS